MLLLYLFAIPSTASFSFANQTQFRNFSSEAAVAKRTTGPSGAGLVQRISSFVVGAGLSALFTQYYIYQEVMYGNSLMLDKQRELEQRLIKLEGKR
jgi:hypothetical protein